MRLFVAILFTENIKDRICSVMNTLNANAVQGNFTARENLHLTLAFIGESTKINEAKRAIDVVHADQFLLDIHGFGKFRRDGGDIFWVGAEETDELISVYKQLYNALSKAGFQLENREYKPHLTLGRRVVLQDCFEMNDFKNTIPEMRMKVEKISLMKSERLNGNLVYTEIYSKSLNETDVE